MATGRRTIAPLASCHEHGAARRLPERRTCRRSPQWGWRHQRSRSASQAFQACHQDPSRGALVASQRSGSIPIRPDMILGKDRLFAYAFAAFFRSGLPLIASRANRSARSLAVSRRVACFLASYAEAACTPSCFHRNKRSARFFAIEDMDCIWVSTSPKSSVKRHLRH